MPRLNIERQNELAPERKEYAFEQINKAGYEILFCDNTKLTFKFKGEKVTLFYYSGWHTGKSIKDGRGLANLLKQLK